jgi:phosphoglycolate phosphatase-like HAD superfamily hydrolase
MKKRLVLFDIDETLIYSGGAGRRAISIALAKLCAVPAEATQINMSGKTDPQILHEILSNAGVSESERNARLPALIELYLSFLESELENGPGYRLLDGVPEVIAQLEEIEGAYLALLTGNVEQGARLKLERFDLNRHFPTGAFGSDAHNRMELPAIACKRASEHYGLGFAPEELVIIGDAENDVLCAKGFGAVSVAVNTGRTTKEALMALEPDFFFETLTDTKQILAAIFSELNVVKALPDMAEEL